MWMSFMYLGQGGTTGTTTFEWCFQYFWWQAFWTERKEGLDLDVRPGRLRWNLRIHPWKRNLIWTKRTKGLFFSYLFHTGTIWSTRFTTKRFSTRPTFVHSPKNLHGTCSRCVEDELQISMIVQPRKLPWNLKIPQSKRKIIFQTSVGMASNLKPVRFLCVLRPGKVPVPDVLVEKAFRRHQWSWQGLDPLGRKTNRKRKAYDAWLQTSGLCRGLEFTPLKTNMTLENSIFNRKYIFKWWIMLVFGCVYEFT